MNVVAMVALTRGLFVVAVLLHLPSTFASAATTLTDPVYVEGSSQFMGFGFDVHRDLHEPATGSDRAPPPPPIGTIAVDVDPSVPLAAGGAWVNVTTKCSVGGDGGWWVGLFPASALMPIRSVNPGDPK